LVRGSIVAILGPDGTIAIGVIEEKVVGGVFAVRCNDVDGEERVAIFRMEELRLISSAKD
jgi:hypothetical protein